MRTADVLVEPDVNLVIKACLLAGRIMLKSGAETYRVEDTMIRIAAACGISAHSFSMPTGIIFSTDEPQTTKLVRISERSTDLQKIVQVNEVSRLLSSGLISINETYSRLEAIYRVQKSYHFMIQTLAAAVTSGCFLLMYGGTWLGTLPAFVAGGLGWLVIYLTHRIVKVKFFAELTAAFVLGITALTFVNYGVGSSLNLIIIAAVMPLVPGILITNAVRDLMAGHLVAGISKGAEACFTAVAIGTGIAVAILVF